MADDLDDFFSDVAEVEAKVAIEEDETKEPPTKKQKSEDDMDDFFNDVDEAAEKAEEEETKEPPSKKPKISGPIRPRGMVVAASSSVVLNKPKPAEEEVLTNSSINNQPTPAIPPPPPPPPPQPTSNTMSTSTQQQQQQSNKPQKPIKRMAAGKVWEDPSLAEWPDNDFRIFCGNLDVTTTDTQLHDHFNKYPSIARSKVVKDANGNGKGFGFVSFLSPLCCAKSIREMDQTWLGSRPIRVKRSDWKDRNASQVKKTEKRRKKQRGY
jgi:hypothetical protein